MTDLEPPKQAVALSFPDSDPTQVKDKLFNEMKIEELNTDGGDGTFDWLHGQAI